MTLRDRKCWYKGVAYDTIREALRTVWTQNEGKEKK